MTEERCQRIGCDDEGTQRFVSVKLGHHGTVIDADGNEVENYISVNLDTGECEVYVTLLGQVVRDLRTNKPKVKTIYRPAPLKFVPER